MKGMETKFETLKAFQFWSITQCTWKFVLGKPFYSMNLQWLFQSLDIIRKTWVGEQKGVSNHTSSAECTSSCWFHIQFSRQSVAGVTNNWRDCFEPCSEEPNSWNGTWKFEASGVLISTSMSSSGHVFSNIGFVRLKTPLPASSLMEIILRIAFLKLKNVKTLKDLVLW